MTSSRTATPLVRAEAARCGVDLATVAGTGAGGRITLQDVRSARSSISSRSARPRAAAAADLPAFTASGLDPVALLQVPLVARPPIAAAPTTADAYALLQDYAGASNEDAARSLVADLRVSDDHLASAHALVTQLDEARALSSTKAVG